MSPVLGSIKGGPQVRESQRQPWLSDLPPVGGQGWPDRIQILSTIFQPFFHNRINNLPDFIDLLNQIQFQQLFLGGLGATN